MIGDVLSNKTQNTTPTSVYRYDREAMAKRPRPQHYPGIPTHTGENGARGVTATSYFSPQ